MDVKLVESHSGAHNPTRLPVTMEIMRKLGSIWLESPPHQDRTMLWAAACEGFFGFLRAGEFSVPCIQAYDPATHLSLSDLSLDSHQDPSLVCLRIKQSKTDPFRQGVEIFLGRTEADVCPVHALLQYIHWGTCLQPWYPLCSSNGGPAHTFISSQPDAGSTGVDARRFNGHSFRIGAATTASMQGLEDSLIQTLGRWRSDAYKTYIKGVQASSQLTALGGRGMHVCLCMCF